MSSFPNMNKTSCYSFLDKHPPSARKQKGEKTPSFGFPPAVALEMRSPDTRWALPSGPTPHKSVCFARGTGWNLEAQTQSTKYLARLVHSLNKAYYSFTLSIPYVHGIFNQIPW